MEVDSFSPEDTHSTFKMPRNTTGGSGHRSQRNSEGSKAKHNRCLIEDLLDDIEELIASRDSRQLSAVPSGKESNDALNDYVGFIASIPEIQDKKSGWRECYNWMIEELKRRGIAG